MDIPTLNRGALLPQSRIRFLILGACVLAPIVWACVLVLRFAPGLDDAYITYRYSRNLYRAVIYWDWINYGFQYNVGADWDRVLGCSAPLYGIFIAVGFFFVSPTAIYFWSVTLNAACACLLTVLMYRFAYARIGARYALLLAALVGLLPSLGFWSWSGMETVPFVLAQVCVWMALTNVQQDKTRQELPSSVSVW